MVALAEGRGLADPERRARILEAMAAAEIDALVAWRPEELVVCTGVAPHLGMSAAVLAGDGRAILYRPSSEPEELIGVGLVDRRYQPGRGPATWADLARLLAADLRALGLRGGRVAVAQEPPRSAPGGNAAESPALTTALVSRLSAEAGAGKIVDGGPIFARLMLRKTEAEVAALRRVHAVADSGLRAFYDGLLDGRTEAELAATVEGAIAGRTGRDGVGLARAWAHVQSGPNTAHAGTFSRSSGRSLQRGDLVLLELAAAVDGMWCDLTRTATVGPPSSSHAALLGAIREAQAAAVARARPGASHAAVDAAARRRLEELRFADGFHHATGHHVGFRYHDPGPMLAHGHDEPLEEGMVLAIEPGSYGPAIGGARFEDNFLITAHGAVPLSEPSRVPA